MPKIRPKQATRPRSFRWRFLLSGMVILLGLPVLSGLLAESPTEFFSIRSAKAAPAAQPCPTCPTPTPTITPTITPTPTPIITSTKPVVTPSQSEINGVISLDGTPSAGFTITLDGRSTAQQVTGPDGRYRFTGLPNGTYKVRVLYDAKKVMPVGQDYSDQAMDGTSVATRNFEFKSVAPPPTATVPVPGPTTSTYNPSLAVVPNSAPPGTLLQVNGAGWNPQGPDGGPNQVTVIIDNSVAGNSSGAFSGQNAPLVTLGTFPVGGDGKLQAQATLPDVAPQAVSFIGVDRNLQKAQTAFTILAAPPAQLNAECPNVAPPPGNGLRLAFKTVQNNADFVICMQAVAGSFGVDLSHTIGVTLPPGTTVARNRPSTGTVSVAGTDVDWGNFTLPARASATLVIQINNASGKLDGSGLEVTGVTSNGISFRRIIPGLPALTEINLDPPAQGGGGTTPTSLPATGNGQAKAEDSFYPVVLTLVLVTVSLFTFSLMLHRRSRRRK